METGKIITVHMDEVLPQFRDLPISKIDVDHFGISLKEVAQAEMVRVVDTNLGVCRVLKDRYSTPKKSVEHRIGKLVLEGWSFRDFTKAEWDTGSSYVYFLPPGERRDTGWYNRKVEGHIKNYVAALLDSLKSFEEERREEELCKMGIS